MIAMRILMGTLGLALTGLVILTGLSGFAREKTTAPIVSAYLFNNGWYDAAIADGYYKAKSFGSADTAAKRGLRLNLTDTRAVRVAGLSKEATGDLASAEKWFAAGSALGWRDSATQIKLFEYAIKRNDFAGSLDHADALLRRQVAPVQLTSIFLIAAGDAALSRDVAGKLASRPSWRIAFFTNPQTASDTYRPAFERVVMLLQKTNAPASRAELTRFAGMLDFAGHAEHALSLWARLFPGDGAVVEKGGSIPLNWPAGDSFEKSGAVVSPITWRFTDNRKAVPVIYSDDSSLPPRLDIDLRDSALGTLATRAVILPAGQVAINLTDSTASAQDLAAIGWSVSCSAGGGKTPMLKAANAATWQADVPANCPAHRIHLELQNIRGGDKTLPVGRVTLRSLS